MYPEGPEISIRPMLSFTSSGPLNDWDWLRLVKTLSTRQVCLELISVVPSQIAKVDELIIAVYVDVTHQENTEKLQSLSV